MKPEHIEKYRRLGLRVAYYRKLRGMTQEQLAEALDKSPAFIGHVEAPGICKAISMDTLFDLAAVLKIPPFRFLYFEDDLPDKRGDE